MEYLYQDFQDKEIQNASFSMKIVQIIVKS